MAIKLIVFDFDGVVADLKQVHFDSLNKAINLIDPSFEISKEDHLSIFDGLSTKKKLELLCNKGFPKDKIEETFKNKQLFTMEMIDSYLHFDEKLYSIFTKLDNYKLYLASNAIRHTVEVGLKKLGIFHFFDKILCNEDVKNQKPHPEIYLKCMTDAGVSPQETLIVEDSKHGRESASLSGAHICTVDNPKDLTLSNIKKCLDVKESKVKWIDKKLNVLIPLAGAGSRFKQEGYKLPKPLIDVLGKPMIQQVVENLNIEANYIFVVQKEHYEDYNLGILLPLISPGCQIVQTQGLTEGAACTTLLVKELINNEDHLLIANSDQFVEWDSCDFMYNMLSSEVDGGLLTFNDTNPKWSFAKVQNGFVTEVAEKNPISDIASVGIYYYNRGSEYVKFAEQMIAKNIRVNNEFYICPVFNEYIQAGKKIKTKNCNKMWGLGTPDDLKNFLLNFRAC